MTAREFNALAMQSIGEPFYLLSSLSLSFDRTFHAVCRIILGDLTAQIREMATNCDLRMTAPLHDLPDRR